MKSMDLEEPELIENIKLALNPKVSYWVLFSRCQQLVISNWINIIINMWLGLAVCDSYLT